MEQLLHSPLLIAIGYALVQSVAQFAALWLLYQVLNVVFTLTSHHKYCLLVTAQLVGFIGFIYTIIAHYFSYSFSDISRTFLFPLTMEDTFLKFFTYNANQYLPYLSALYLVVLLVFFYRLSRAFIYAQNLQLQPQNTAPTFWQNFVLAKSAELKIKKTVKIFVSEYIHTPLTIGYFKPIILVPLSCITNLTTAQMEAVLLHELAHIKRHDYLLNIMLCAIQHILYFNPFTWLISKQINVQREYSCDDWVIRHQYSPAVYAQALVSVAMSIHPKQAFAIPASDKNLLICRIKRLVTKHTQNRFRINVSPVLLSLLVVLISVINPANTKEKENNNYTIAEKPELQTMFEVDNAIINLNVDLLQKKNSKRKATATHFFIKESNNNIKKEESKSTDNTTLINLVKMQEQPKTDKNNMASVVMQLESALENNLLKADELIYINNALIKLWQEKYKSDWNADNELPYVHTADYIASSAQAPDVIMKNIKQILNNVKQRNNQSAEETPSLFEKVIVIEMPQSESDSCRQVIITEKLLKIIRI